MENKNKIFIMMGITVALIVLAIVSLATADWIHTSYKTSLGLWQTCFNGNCESFQFKVADFVNATRAFHIIGLLFLCCAFACLARLLSQSDGSYKAVAGMFGIAGICYMISMSVFTGYYDAEVVYYYGYSYILGWVVSGGALALCAFTAKSSVS